MVRVYSKHHVYDEPVPIPLLAFFLRYPNPFAGHVLSVDVLERHIDDTGRLYTKRLVLKRGVIPQWASKWMPPSAQSGGRGLDAWIIEESVVDPPGWSAGGSSVPTVLGNRKGKGKEREMEVDLGEYRRSPRLRFTQGNLNHRRFMYVREGGELYAKTSGSTIQTTTAEIVSQFGGAWSSMIRQRIESYAMGKFEKNTEKSRQGMSLVMTSLRSRQPIPDTAEFYPPPPPSFGESWPAANSPAEGDSRKEWFWTRWRR